jgi:hypothetical protein
MAGGIGTILPTSTRRQSGNFIKDPYMLSQNVSSFQQDLAKPRRRETWSHGKGPKIRGRVTAKRSA